ncbi:M3 family metallopeptidase [Fulvivirgaceae bacterium BMA10]|uniref:M3 family metallopeptidase n=1 Tax=Splendidivirga corallicola TaxID=3051826 RepID=A0ABT8KIQ7_9BACT|nr:M3 family metallopeptidase [Fulvivirgaceae bacterium BMA10]
MNPLLEKFNTPYETAPFDKIKNEHYLPAIKEAIALAKKEIQDIKENNEASTFENSIEALERSGELVGKISTIFFNLNSAETNDEIQKLAQEISPLLTEYSNDIKLDGELFNKVKTVYEQTDAEKLSPEERTLLEKTYKGFVRNGANLSSEDKQKLREIDVEISKLSLTFGEHVLAETNEYELVIENQEDLKGLPESAIEAAAMVAKSKGKEGQWVITLDYPSYVPFMTYAENRQLRETLFRAFSSRAFKEGEYNNEDIIKKIVSLRHQRAMLLGYNSHAHFILEERMAKSPQKVIGFLDEILSKAKTVAREELQEVSEYARSIGGPDELQRWDYSFYSEKLKKEKFSIEDEILKPYFKLENVIEGVFQIAEKLYGLRFEENKDIPVYHSEVTAYEVKDQNDDHVAIFYADFFPRPGKRNGAWMTSYRGQRLIDGQNERPHISIVCNFTKPTETKPSLLTFNEVTTLFHEFGHALHGMLANGKYESLSGTNVFWDFVELPSQILENWCYEKECLDLFAVHYETDQKIPEDFIRRIKESSNFMEGLATLRQLGFGKLDMAWHDGDPVDIEDVEAFENEILQETNLFPELSGVNMSCSFGHIFQGGYSAGYYSYKWAEVLDADAFEYFKTKGIFNKDVANAFKDNILSAGGREHPMILYKRFRGQEPSIEPLLRRAGIIKDNAQEAIVSE